MNCRRQRTQGADGSDVEDTSRAFADHLSIDRLRHGKQTVDIRVNDLVPGTVSGSCEVVAAVDRRIVDENVDAAPLLDELAREFFHPDAVDD